MIAWVLMACTGETDKGPSAEETGVVTSPPDALVLLTVKGLEFGPDDREGNVEVDFFERPSDYAGPTEGCTRTWEETPEVEFLEVVRPETFTATLDGSELEDGIEGWPEGSLVGVRSSGGEVPDLEELDAIAIPRWDLEPSRTTAGNGSVDVTWTTGDDGALARLLVLGDDDVLDCFFADTGQASVDASDVEQLGGNAIWRMVRHAGRLIEGEGYVVHATAESGISDF